MPAEKKESRSTKQEVPKRYSLDEPLDLIEKDYSTKCKTILKENISIFKKAKGSAHNHQAWKGGYLDHITDTMNSAIIIYDLLASTRRPLPFKLSDALLVLFLHDIEKPFKQFNEKIKLRLLDSSGKKDRSETNKFREELFKRYKLNLTDQQINAIKYIEGENEDYSSTKRVMGELATFCHICDVISARLWYNFPDPWLSSKN